jgi:hypothetical protein
MRDTPPDVEQRYREMIMSLSPSERLAMASRMFDTARALMIAGIKHRMPSLSPAQIRAQLFMQLYGNDITPSLRDKILKRISEMQWDADD